MIKENMEETNKSFMEYLGGLDLKKIDETNYTPPVGCGYSCEPIDLEKHKGDSTLSVDHSRVQCITTCAVHRRPYIA